MSILYPLINGHRFDFSSVEINVAGIRFQGIKSLSYKETLDHGYIRGNRAQVLGRTRGTHTAEGSLEMYKSEADLLMARLSVNPAFGYMEAAFDIMAVYNEVGSIPQTDRLVGCRIKALDISGSESNEALTVKMDMHIMYIQLTGKTALSPLQLLR